MRRNKYEFKWWHGVLGLIGLSMVLGTARSMRAPQPTSTWTTRVYPFGYSGYPWEVDGPVPATGIKSTEQEAIDAAQAWIESHAHRNPMQAGAL